MVILAAFTQAAENQLDRHADGDLPLIRGGHLTQKTATAVDLDYGHHGGQRRGVVQVVLRERKDAAGAAQRDLEQSLRVAADGANARDGKLHGATPRTFRAVQADVLALPIFPEDVRDFGAAFVLAHVHARFAVARVAG